MKIFFYSFILLFVVVSAYAQKTVNYVSFFPPANVVHSEVVLTQTTNSFDFVDAQGNGAEGTDYTAKLGGLVLGAAPNSEITISTVTIVIPAESKKDTILNFKVDNIIKLSSKGALKDVTIGKVSECGYSYNDCTIARISANDISFPFIANYPKDLNTNVRVANTANIGTYFVNDSYNFLPALSSGDKLKWVSLRVNGTEDCRKYLVKYSSTDPEPSDTACHGPSWDQYQEETKPDPEDDL